MFLVGVRPKLKQGRYECNAKIPIPAPLRLESARRIGIGRAQAVSSGIILLDT
jgi:hypothetical protein